MTVPLAIYELCACLAKPHRKPWHVVEAKCSIALPTDPWQQMPSMLLLGTLRHHPATVRKSPAAGHNTKTDSSPSTATGRVCLAHCRSTCCKLVQCQAVHLHAGPSTRGDGSSKGSSLKAAAAELDAHQYVHRSKAVKGTLVRKDQRPSLNDVFADQPDVQLEVLPDSAQAAGRLPQNAQSAYSGRERLAAEEAAVQVWCSRAGTPLQYNNWSLPSTRLSPATESQAI